MPLAAFTLYNSHSLYLLQLTLYNSNTHSMYLLAAFTPYNSYRYRFSTSNRVCTLCSLNSEHPTTSTLTACIVLVPACSLYPLQQLFGFSKTFVLTSEILQCGCKMYSAGRLGHTLGRVRHVLYTTVYCRNTNSQRRAHSAESGMYKF